MRQRLSNCLYLILLMVWISNPAFGTEPAKGGSDTVVERDFKPSATQGLLFPLYIPEYLIRVGVLPLEMLVTYSERVDLPARVTDLISNDARTMWYYPTFSFFSRDGFAVGANFLHNNLFDEKKEIAFSGNVFTNEDHSLSLSYSKPANLNSPLFYSLDTSYFRDSNARFYGIGDTSEDLESVFTDRQIESMIRFGWKFRKLQFVKVLAETGYLFVDVSPGDEDDSRPSLETTFPLTTITGFGEELSLLKYGLTVEYDSQIPRGHPYRGGVMRIRYVRGDSISDSSFGFNRINVQLTRMINLYQQDRVLAFGVQFETTEGFGKTVPFYELSRLGRNSPLRGFPNGRFTDRRFLLGNVEYRYPIWRTYNPTFGYALGTIFFDVGKTFDAFDDIQDGALKYAGGCRIHDNYP